MWLANSRPIVQVKTNNIHQFYDYVSIHPNIPLGVVTYADCVIQSLFCLGLRNITALYKDVAYIQNISASSGVLITDICIYLDKTFGLESGTTSVWEPPNGNFTVGSSEEPPRLNKTLYDNFEKIYDYHLKDNHSTILFVWCYWYITKKYSGHSFIVFKHNNKIGFFDPQQNIISDKLSGILLNSGIMTTFLVFTTKNINPMTYAKDTTRTIKISG